MTDDIQIRFFRATRGALADYADGAHDLKAFVLNGTYIHDPDATSAGVIADDEITGGTYARIDLADVSWSTTGELDQWLADDLLFTGLDVEDPDAVGAVVIYDNGDNKPLASITFAAVPVVGDLPIVWPGGVVATLGDNDDDLTDLDARVTDHETRIETLEGGGAGGAVVEVQAGSGITVDATDPQRPVVTATGGDGDDSALVHLAGAETITGTKTFTGPILASTIIDPGSDAQVDVGNQELYDDDGQPSVDWTDRELTNAAGTKVADWTGSGVDFPVAPTVPNAAFPVAKVSGLGTAATKDVGTGSGDVAAGNAPAAAISAHVGATDPHGDRAYAAGLFATNDALLYKGAIDCSTNPNYPAADAGNEYKVSVAGKIGGASGPNVEVGDRLICNVDSSASGNHATIGANWDIIQGNLDGAVIGPISATADHFAKFDGTSGRLIKDGGVVGTASALDVAASGDAASGQVVKGNDTRLLDLFAQAIKTTAYTVTAWAADRLDTTAGTFAATLPTTPPDRTRCSLKWVTGTVAPTVNAGGTATFNKTGGSATATLSLVNQAQEYLYYAADNVWIAYTSNSTAALDGRYALAAQLLQGGFYGTGVDGDVTISSNTTITSNAVAGFKQYRNLTINAGVTLTVVGKVYVSQTLTNNGTISADGTNGAGTAGGVGGNGIWPSSITGNGGNGSVTTTSTGGQPVANPSSGQLIIGGAAGGAGGAGSSGAGGVSGLAYTGTTWTETGMMSDPAIWLTGMFPNRATNPNGCAGAGRGGGGGGGDGSNVGGGAGGGGGYLVICARHVAGTGAISAKGGNGVTRVIGNVGGGGGGGGGFIGLMTGDASHSFTLVVTGGTGGTGAGTGTAGSNGSTGNTAVLLGVA